MRIGGLASGMDIDTLVGDLMKAERLPLDKMFRNKQTLEWQRDDYRSMNSLLKELDTSIFDGVFRQATFSKKTVTSSNEDAVTAKNINSTSNLNATISVTQLAKAAHLYGGADIRSNTNFDPNAKLSDQITAGNIQDFTTSSFTIQSIKADGTLGEAVSFTVDPSKDSLNSLLDRINNDSKAGVTAFFDSQTGKISMTAKNSGDVAGDAEIKLLDTSGTFLTNVLKLPGDNLTLDIDSDSDGIYDTASGAGKNAIFTFNGLATERSTNTFTINGFEYTLKATTTTDVNITSATDVDSIFDSVKSFVDKYNEIIGKINDEISEERYRDYAPLTDEEKEVMEDRTIELWEEKARSGMLRNDSILSSALNSMRVDLYSRVGTDTDGVNDDYDQLSEIGITTSSNYLAKGKLVINEAKLKDAISKDPNAIYQLFTNDSTTYESKGLARRLRDTISSTMSKVENRAGNSLKTNSQFTIGKQLISFNDRINAFEDRLIQIEDRYWRQFTAMEKAIQRSNEQSVFLMNSFGG
jgi:flagellar hook-associated protein 2